MVRMNILQKALGNINNATHNGADSERTKQELVVDEEIGGFRRKACRGRWEEGAAFDFRGGRGEKSADV